MKEKTDIKELRKLAVKATPGPWEVSGTGQQVLKEADVPYRNQRICETNSIASHYLGKTSCLANLSFIAAANPQAIIEVLDMVDRYREALHSCEVRSGHIENWHRDHVTPDNFKDCQDVGVTPEAYLRETKMIAREALEGGK